MCLLTAQRMRRPPHALGVQGHSPAAGGEQCEMHSCEIRDNGLAHVPLKVPILVGNLVH